MCEWVVVLAQSVGLIRSQSCWGKQNSEGREIGATEMILIWGKAH